MPFRGVLICALLVVAAGDAAAVEGSMSARTRGWVRWSESAQVRARAARDRAAATTRGGEPSAAPLTNAPRPGTLGTIAWTSG